jgi:hypothetical protein
MVVISSWRIAADGAAIRPRPVRQARSTTTNTARKDPFRVTQIARLTLEFPGRFLPVPQASMLEHAGLRFRGLLRKQLLRWNYPNGTRPPFTGSHAAAGRARTTFFRKLATVGFWRTS